MAKSVGIDLVEISRIEEKVNRSGVKFLEKFCTDAELRYANKGEVDNPEWKYESIAGMYAAKEAFGKAMNTGIAKGVNLKEIEVQHDRLGNPVYQVYGSTFVRFKEAGYSNPLLSISHEGGMAVAMCIFN